MEERIAHLESDVAHMRTDIADIKVDLRSLRDKTDEMWFRLTEKIDAVDVKLSEKIETGDARLSDRIDGLSGEVRAVADSLASAKLWALLLYVGFAAAMLGTMARGFGWL